MTTTAIAEIGFVADSSQLTNATAALDRLSQSAGRAEAAAGGAAGGMGKLEQAAKGGRSGMLGFLTVLGLVGRGVLALVASLATAITGIIAIGGAYTEMKNSLAQAVGGLHLADTALIQLTTIAVKNGVAVGDLVNRYREMSVAMKALGLSAQQSINFIGGVSNALDGAGVKGAAAAQLWQALDQAMSQNKVTTEQLNQIMQNGGMIAGLLAKELNTTVGGLREMARTGTITGDALYNAVVKNLELLREEADKTPKSVAAAFSGLGTAFSFLVAEIDRATGLSQFFSRIIQSVTKYVLEMAHGAENFFLNFGYGISKAWHNTKVFFENLANAVLASSMSMVNIVIGLVNDAARVALKGLNFLIDGANAIGAQLSPINENFALIDPFPQAWIDSLRRGSQAIGPWYTSVQRSHDALTAGQERTTKAVEGTGKAYDRLMANAKRREQQLMAEGRALFMNAQETEILKEQTDLLSKAQERGIALSPAQLAALVDQGEAFGKLRHEIDVTKKALDFTKSALSGFITDMRDGLMRGEGFLKSFANAAINLLTKVSNKLIDMAIDMAFQSKGSGGGGGGWMASLFSGLFGGSGGGAGSASSWGTMTVTPAAKGGVFANQVYDQPTMFAFARGAAFGVMGEAGPEAVMPLKRGPDGSLGVEMHGSSDAGGPRVLVQVINNADNTQVREERSQNSDGTDVRKIIIDTVRKGMGDGEFDTTQRARFGAVPNRVLR